MATRFRTPRGSRTRRSLFSLAALVLPGLLIAALPAGAMQISANYDPTEFGCDYTWTQAHCWDTPIPSLPDVVPINGTDTFLVTVLQTPSPTGLPTNLALDGLETVAGVTLDLADGSTFSIVGDPGDGSKGSFVDNGILNINAASHLTDWIVDGGTVTVSGTGKVHYSDSSSARIYTNDGSTFVNGAGHTIEGAVQLGLNTLTLVNHGTILADAALNKLIVDPGAGQATNTGLMKSSQGGTLRLDGGTYTNTGGTIGADYGSLTELSGATIVGGTLQSSGTGVVRNVGSAALDGSTGGIVLNGGSTFEGANNTTTTLRGALTNRGTFSVVGGPNLTNVVIAGGTVTLDGGGTVQLSDSPTNRLYSSDGSTLVNQDNLIRGSGQLGLNSTGIVNRGIIQADQPNALQVDPGTLGAVNSGLLWARSGGRLVVGDGSVANFEGLTDGLIESLDGSTVAFSGATVTGGMVEVQGTGTIELNGSTLTGGTFQNSATGMVTTTGGTSQLGGSVTNPLGGQLHIADNTALFLQGGGSYSNAGDWFMDGASHLTDFGVTGGTATLTGGGTFTFSDSATNRIYTSDGSTFVNQDNLIQGAGQLGLNSLTLENHGSIVGNAAVNKLIVDPGAGQATNTGTMKSSAGGTLRLDGGTYTNTGGTIGADDGSLTELSGATIVGGTLQTSGTGVVRNVGSAALDGSSGGVVLNGAFEGANNSTTTLLGALTNHGTFSVLGGPNLTNVVIAGGTVTLDGGGTVQLSDSPTNRLYSSDSSTFVNQDNLIQGSGQLGLNSTGIVNRGIIQADQSNALQVDPGTLGAINSGILEATSGGRLVVGDGSVANFEGLTPGLIESLDGSTVAFSSATVTGGSVQVQGTGTIELNGSILTGGTFQNSATGMVTTTGGTSQLGGSVTNPLGGQLHIANNSALFLQGGGSYTNAGDWFMDSTGSLTDFGVTGGTATLTGGGTFTFSDSPNNLIYTSDGSTFVNQDNLIQGAGQLGLNSLTLENHGSIVGNAAVNKLIVDPGAGQATNTGTMKSSAGGTLRLDGGTYTNTGGTVGADNGSLTELSGATIVGGTLQTSGTGVVRNVGSAALDGSSGGVVLNGAFEGANNSTTTLLGALTNHGTFSVLGGPNLTNVVIAGGTVTLDGGGTVQLSDSPANRLYSSDSSTLVNQDNLIQGAGYLGLNSTTIENHATILANAPTNKLIVDPGAGGLTNTATIKATGGGTLRLEGGTYTNTVGTIGADDGSLTELSSATIVGGTLQTAGSGLFRNVGSAALDGGSGGIVLNGAFEAVNNSTTTLHGTLTNHGTFSVLGGPNLTDVVIAGGSVTLDGGGTVQLSDSTSNRLYSSDSSTLVNQDNVIRGSGQVLLGLQNAGILSAAGSSGLALSGVPKVNDGLFRAETGSTLSVASNVTGTGAWRADGGSIQLASGVNVTTTGNIDVVNGGLLKLQNASMTASNLFLDGLSAIDIAGALSVDGDLTIGLTDESHWTFDTSSVLKMTGGMGTSVGNWSSWGSLEVGGMDIGSDPVNHVGDPNGFSSNFNLATLEIGPGAKVFLADLIDNGNRGGSTGFAEALYVDTLVFDDTAGLLDLNGLDLYYKNLVGSTAQIIDVHVPEPPPWLLLLAPLAALASRRRVRQRARVGRGRGV